MSGAVNVLAVLDNFIDPVNFPHQPHDLTDARAVVAELIEAASVATAMVLHDGASSREACDRLIAATARCKGGAA